MISKVKTAPVPPPLRPLLRAAGYRRRLQASLERLLLGLMAGLVLTLLLTLAGRLAPLAFPARLLAIGAGLTAAGLAVTQLYTWLRPVSPAGLARWLDTRFGLDERLTTALELAGQPGQTPPAMVRAQLAETSRYLRQFDLARRLPLTWPWRRLGLIALLAAALAANLFLPNPQVELLNRQARVEESIAQQKARFEEIRARLLDDEALLATPQGQELQQTLAELIRSLDDKELDLEEAMAVTSTAEQKLARLQEQNEAGRRLLDDLAQTFNQFESTRSLAESLAQRQPAAAGQALTAAGSRPENAQEMVGALQQAARTAQAAGQTDLAGALDQAAAKLARAAATGEAGDSQAAQAALRRAAEAMAAAGQQLANQAAIEQALANIQEAREQLAEAGGQGAGKGPGQALGGQAQIEPGPATGGGSGREDPGPGAAGLTAEQGTSAGMSTGNGPNEGRRRDYESVYAPQHLGGEGGPIVKPAEQGATGGLPIGQAPLDPHQEPGQALVPYNQVYGQYRDAASQALDKSYIPLGLKGYIRQYFGALEPEN